MRKLFALSVLSVAFLFVACGGEKEATTAPVEEVEAVEAVEETAVEEEAAEEEAAE